MREHWEQLVRDQNPTCIMTLGEGRRIAIITMQGKIKHYLNAVQKETLGRYWTKFPAAQRITAIGFREHHETNPHWHLAIHADSEMRMGLADSRKLWAKIRPTGDWYYDFLDDADRYAHYITKELFHSETADNVFVYTPDLTFNL